ncbi:substrate-binding domain-containing protein [Algicella marina]|nr:substrate-binding domain-containing protein [Algicella marina]
MAEKQRPTGKPRPTLKTIAYITGLGVTTVSRALSDAPDISKATKARVRTVAREIGYRPNRAGVRLRTGKTNVISFILNMKRDKLGTTTHLMQGLTHGLAGTAYHLIVTPAPADAEDLSAVQYVVETGSADGIILSDIEPQDIRAAYLQERGFPFVTHGRPGLAAPAPYVDFDNHAFATHAAERLRSLGRSRLALIQPPAHYAYAQHMLEGFRAVVDAHDLIEVPLRDISSESPRLDVINEIARILASRHRPDGIVASTVMSCLAATAAIEAAGLRIGTDIDIVAKEPLELLRLFRPEIHVMHEDLFRAGADMARAMLVHLDDSTDEIPEILHQPSGFDGD